MGTVLLRTLSSLLLVGGLLALRYVSSSGHTGPGQVLSVQRPLMGTVWNIEVVDHGSPEEARAAIENAYSELQRIDALMSEWKPDSPISQVNSAAGLHSVDVPAELRELLERSVRYSEMTEGTFDITWRGMGHIWHFDDAFQPPARAAVEAAKKKVNYRALQIRGNRVFLPEGMSIGLGGIAKGYAVDRAAKVLSDSGFTDHLVDGGGDVLVSGTRYGEPWRLGVQDPRQPRRDHPRHAPPFRLRFSIFGRLRALSNREGSAVSPYYRSAHRLPGEQCYGGERNGTDGGRGRSSGQGRVHPRRGAWPGPGSTARHRSIADRPARQTLLHSGVRKEASKPSKPARFESDPI